MRSFLLTIAAAALAFPADPVAKVESPVLGYVYDAKARAVRPITGIPGAASLESTLPSASKLANGFVSHNRQWLLAILLDGGVALMNLQSGASTSLEGAPADAAMGAWSADGTTFALWSRSGVLQVWTGAPDAPAAKYSHVVETAAGIALADRGESVLFWSEAGLFAAAEGNVRQLVAEPVLAAAYRPDSSEWAALTTGQLLRSDAEPRPLAVAGAAAVAFVRDGLVVAAKRGVEVIGETASRTIPCDCDATFLDRLAGNDVFRLTGLDSSNLAVYDGSSSEPVILYIPNEGGRQ